MRTDREFIGEFTMRQQEGVFPLGSDSQALGNFVQIRKGETVCDLGCGGGVLGLYLFARERDIRLTALDISADAVELAKENFAANGLSADVRHADLRVARELFPAGSFDLAVSNPPYFSVGSGYSGGSTRMEETCTLTDLCAAAKWLVRNGGRFAIVHRPERLADLFAALREHMFEPKRLQFIQAAGKPPSAVLIEAYKEGKPGLSVLPVDLR